MIECGCIPFPDTCKLIAMGVKSQRREGSIDPIHSQTLELPGEAAAAIRHSEIVLERLQPE